MKKKRKKLGFALGAGGSRGVAHIGFLKAMEEADIRSDFITGSSMGSVVGAAYSAGMSIEEMKNAVFKLRLLDLIAPTGHRGGVFDTKKIRRLLKYYIGDPDFSELKIPFQCLAVDMISQSTIIFKEGNVLDGVVASSSIPAIFKPTEKNGMRLIDGGILERVPFKEVKDMGADVVVAVDVLGRLDCSEKMPTTLGVLLETLDMMDNLRTQTRREMQKHLYDIWIEPRLGNMNQFSLKQIVYAYDKGYEIGLEYVDKIKQALKG